MQLIILLLCLLLIEIPCTTLPPLGDHMIINVTSLTLNSILTLSCSEGYELVGNSTLVCGAGGEWTGTKPNCESKILLPCIQVFIDWHIANI